MFTAVAVMQLAQAGKLDLNAPVGAYLKDYPNNEIAQKVTINHLLTHTGGTGDSFTREAFKRRNELRDAKDYVNLFGARAPDFPSGRQRKYSNYGFILLGRIVEVVSGLTYDEYLQQNIFAPARMVATGMEPESSNVPMRAVAYMYAAGDLKSAAENLPYRGTPASGGYSTVVDMFRFAQALMTNQLLDREHTQLHTNGGITSPGGQFFPYPGAGRKTDEGRPYIGHHGGMPGVNGALQIFPKEKFVIVVLANRDPPVAEALADFISARFP